jgi:hypothetical protein
MKLTLWTTLPQFEQAHVVLKRAGKRSVVKLSTETLRNLLRDHSALHALLRGEVHDDKPPVKRERLR